MFNLDIILYTRKIPVHMFQTTYIYNKSYNKTLIESYVDDELYKESGAKNIGEFVCSALSDEMHICHKWHFSIDYGIHIEKFITLLEQLDMRGIFHCIINEEKSRSIYLYFITKKEE